MKTASIAIVAGFCGGLMGFYAAGHWDADDRLAPRAIAATPPEREVVSVRSLRLLDAHGKMRAQLAMAGDGGPALFFFDEAGRNRMVLGLYSVAEGQAPFVVLNDREQKAAGIFRLFGANEAPVVVLKNRGLDRSIYGLQPQSLEPFLVNIAADGKKLDVFGKY